MLKELVNLTKKAIGTEYESLFREVHELTVAIEVAYAEKFPNNENKILYFHEKYTRAFISTYGLLMKNLEEGPYLAIQQEDDIKPTDYDNYTRYLAAQINKKLSHVKRDNDGGKPEPTRTEAQRAWYLHNKTRMGMLDLYGESVQKTKLVPDTFTERRFNLFGETMHNTTGYHIDQRNVDGSNNIAWFCFPNEYQLFKLHQEAKNTSFIEEMNTRYFLNKNHVASTYDSVVDYLIDDTGFIILDCQKDTYLLVSINQDNISSKKQLEYITFTPVSFSKNNTQIVYEREHLKQYITLASRHIKNSSVTKNKKVEDILWKMYQYDTIRWSLHTKPKVQGGILWSLTYGNLDTLTNPVLFKQLVSTLYSPYTDSIETKAEADSIIRAYDRAIDFLKTKEGHYPYMKDSRHDAIYNGQ